MRKVNPCLIQLVEVIMKALKEKVRELRKRKGWAQEDLAREMGVSLSTVQRWENKGGEPTRLARRELRKFFQEAGVDDGDQGER
jgi:transcriptional regulator with XRE-family HTH domain